MTRYTIFHDDKVLAFGNDHVCGEYLQIYTRPADLQERKSQDSFGPNPEEMLVDEDKHTGFTREKMLKLIAEHGFDLSELESAYNMGINDVIAQRAGGRGNGITTDYDNKRL